MVPPPASWQSRQLNSSRCKLGADSASRATTDMMHFLLFTSILISHLARVCFGLLEEDIVSFDPLIATNGTVNIVDCPVICSEDDYIGVHIAVRSLATDLEQITGNTREIFNFTTIDSTALPSIHNAIIVASINSSLIRSLSARNAFDISEIQGKWESFKTTVVENPLPGLRRALVIAGSDKRGAIFGAHTLAEQSGQSP
jgi:hypothetical protein